MRRQRPAVDGGSAGAARDLPHNLEAERSLLGAIVIQNALLDVVASTVTPDHFYREAHRRIYAGILTLQREGRAIDFVTLTEALGAHLEAVGGPAYLASLTDGVPRSTNIRHYAAMIMEHALRRAMIQAGNRLVAAAYEAEAPALTVLAEADHALLALHARNGITPHALSETANTRFQTMEWRVARKGELRGLGTGYPSIDELTMGLRAGDLDIVAARPSMGKSALAGNIAVHAALAGSRVLICSLEMTREQLEDRILAQLSQVALSRIQSGHIAESEWSRLAQAIETMNTLPVILDDRPGLTAIDIRTTCRRAAVEEGSLGLVVVDYIQLITSAVQRKGATRTEELSDAATRLKDLAKELRVPVLLLSQLRRVEGCPKIEDLRECGALEQVADIVAFLHRKDHRLSGTTEFVMAKQRNGPCGTVLLTMNRETTTFTDGAAEPIPEAEAEEQATRSRRGRTRTFAQRWAQREA